MEISDLSTLEDLNNQKLNEILGGQTSASTAGATQFGATSAGASNATGDSFAFSGLPQPAPNPAPFSFAASGTNIPPAPTFN